MVYFKEVLPNPVGRDTEGEWVTVVNTGDTSVPLSGWTLSDKSGKTFSFTALPGDSRTLEPQGELTLTYSTTRISLNNDGETLELTDAAGNVADTLTYAGPIADDEVVFGGHFTPVVEERALADVEALAQAASPLAEGIVIAPVAVAVFLALVFGIGAGLVARKQAEG